MKKIIWLTGWFPGPEEPYSGDAIERHARAASLHNRIHLIHIRKTRDPLLRKPRFEHRVYSTHLSADIIEYPGLNRAGKLLDKLWSGWCFFMYHNRALKTYMQTWGKPDGIHINIMMKCGLVGMWWKWRHGLRYLLMERWGGYLPEAIPHFSQKGRWFLFLLKKILRHSSGLITVSRHLGLAISQQIIPFPFRVIPNVVDLDLFYPGPSLQQRPFRFIHISSLDYPKNPEDLLVAMKKTLQSGHQAVLDIYGPRRELLMDLAASLGLGEVVFFHSEAPQAILAQALRRSHALILYSRYETFGNVIIEANACGLPVIVSDYATFLENVEPGVTGLKARGNDPGALSQCMVELMETYVRFDPANIARLTADKYSFEKVGLMIDALYREYF